MAVVAAGMLEQKRSLRAPTFWARRDALAPRRSVPRPSARKHMTRGSISRRRMLAESASRDASAAGRSAAGGARSLCKLRRSRRCQCCCSLSGEGGATSSIHARAAEIRRLRIGEILLDASGIALVQNLNANGWSRRCDGPLRNRDSGGERQRRRQRALADDKNSRVWRDRRAAFSAADPVRIGDMRKARRWVRGSIEPFAESFLPCTAPPPRGRACCWLSPIVQDVAWYGHMKHCREASGIAAWFRGNRALRVTAAVPATASVIGLSLPRSRSYEGSRSRCSSRAVMYGSAVKLDYSGRGCACSARSTDSFRLMSSPLRRTVTSLAIVSLGVLA